MRAVLKVLGVIALVLVLIAVLLGVWLAWTIRRSWPVTDGAVDVPGVSAPVDVVRDARGVPQIYADDVDDLFVALGYTHAQDRFWEMDFRRHITSGRLSEMFGKSQVDTDAFIRTLGWRRTAEQEYGMLSARSKQILQAYAKGVNAYLADHSGASLSLEYQVLALQNPSYTVEPWDPVDSVAWLKALAWDLHGNEGDELDRALTASVVGVRQTEELYPPYPYARHTPIVTQGAVVDGRFDQNATTPGGAAAGAASVPAAAQPALLRARSGVALLESVLGPIGEGIGSNSWAVGPAHTASGKPLLANDPHLAPQMPSLWYQAGLHCRTISADCAYDVAGWTMSGLPGIFIGHNARIAWGFTNLGPDVSDLVLEKVDGDTYQVDGKQLPLRTRQEVIRVAGGDPVTITVKETEHGPLLSEVPPTDDNSYADVGKVAPVPAPGQAADRQQVPARGQGYAVALEWTALTPRPTFDAFDILNTAADWQGFRAAARLLAVPSQNLVYADVDGNIGYQSPGEIPVRRGYDGKWPVPGWSSQYAWTGTIPFDALPSVLNPADGFVVTANQAVTYPGYPYFLTDDWSYGARSQRIRDRITAAVKSGRKLTVADMQSIQMDARNELASFLVPRMKDLPVDSGTRQAMALFDGWDFQQPVDSAAGAFFNAFYRQLVTRMFDSKLSTTGVEANASDRYWTAIEDLWDRPADAWWDDGTTSGTRETRDATVTAALNAASAEMRQLQGDDPAGWQWGRMHTLLLQNQSLGKSGIAPVEWLFNRGPAPVGGGSAIVQATGWTPSNGYEVDWVPSMRQVIDLSDLDASTWVNLTGQSGHAFNPLYNDQFEAWRTGEQYPWAFSRPAVDAASSEVLSLRPPAG